MAKELSETDPGVLLLDELEEGFTSVQFAIAPTALELEDDRFAFPQPVACAATVVRSLETYNVKGHADCLVQGECCRCLTPTKMNVRAEVRLLVQRREAVEEALEALEDQEMEILDPGAKEMDLREQIRDDVILELPHRLLCREECKGLCPTCGRDFNEGSCSCSDEAADPRWAALANIRF